MYLATFLTVACSISVLFILTPVSEAALESLPPRDSAAALLAPPLPALEVSLHQLSPTVLRRADDHQPPIVIQRTANYSFHILRAGTYEVAELIKLMHAVFKEATRHWHLDLIPGFYIAPDNDLAFSLQMTGGWKISWGDVKEIIVHMRELLSDADQEKGFWGSIYTLQGSIVGSFRVMRM